MTTSPLDLDALEARATAYEGYYVDAKGNVWSTRKWKDKTPHKLATFLNRGGYLHVYIQTPKRKHICVHVLVCVAFHGEKPTEKHQVRHFDGDKANNSEKNLLWGTSAEDAADRKRHGREVTAINAKASGYLRRGCKNSQSKLTETQVRDIRKLRSAGLTGRKLAQMFGMHNSNIYKIASGYRYKDVV